MLKKRVLIGLLVMLSVAGYAQNEVGAFLIPQYTRIFNAADGDEPQYKTGHTFSKGFGVNFIHFFHGKRDTRKNKRFAFRGDLMWSGHSQGWKATYRIGPGRTEEWEGKKRLDYIKIAPQFEMSIPLNKHMSMIYFGGPQLSILFDVDGGIVVWEDRGVYDYFDLPEADKSYYKPFTIDAVFGMGVDYEYTKWINLTAGFRTDISLTKVENPNDVINGRPSYNVEIERGGSHNFTLGIFIGAEYTLHKPQYAKTRF